ncbi:MAG TPA: 6-carboxytetrahydropterin synthase [Tepidisphaeraceae bacterium]|nr:6-carboxytetrahydropterin synthase [Tepidisphaeraceae bacterium]
MFRLTREVRFAVNLAPDEQLDQPTPSNSYGGYPTLTGFGQYFTVQVTIQGQPDPTTCYLRNIREIDRAVRQKLIPAIRDSFGRALSGRGNAGWLASAPFAVLHDAFAPDRLHAVTIWLTPYLCVSQLAWERPMTRLSQKFEFCASHRLHNPALPDQTNRQIYGKCNNPSGHGHNYELQVTLRGTPNDNGLLVDVPAFERIVKQHVIDRLDHMNLNIDVPEFRNIIPTVENIAMIIYRMLKNHIAGIGAELASVTVWETPKTWCEYSE